MSWKTIRPEDWELKPVQEIGKDWMLVSSGDLNEWNTMTASWGGIGVMWNKPTAFVFVRPSRYTYEFIESRKDFSLTFFNKKYRKLLGDCGSKSGRDWNKMKETGLTPWITEKGYLGFEEAKLIVTCSLTGSLDLTKDSLHMQEDLDTFYPKGNFHRLYFGEIKEILSK